jgi:hypothetical protein
VTASAGWIAAWIALIGCATAPQLRAQPVSSNAVRSTVMKFYSALARGDTATLRPQLADVLEWIIGANGATVTKAQLLMAAGRPQVPAPRFEVDSVRALWTGGAAIVEYLRTDHRTVGAQDFATHSRALDVWRARGAQLQLERHTQAWLVSPVTPVPVDSLTLQAYVGHYQIAPGYVDDVHWEGGRLVATASGQSAGAWLAPVSTNAFSPDGVGALIVFERDAAGRVLDYVQGYPDGRVIRAMRLP